MLPPWLRDTEDPRTILIGSIGILAFGCLVAPRMMAEGAVLAVLGSVWIVVSVGQVVWAARRYRAWRSNGPSDRPPTD